jgi:hypothetical protein
MDRPHTEACRLWLELENPRGDHPRFCPNARFLQACRTGSGSGGGRQASRPASAFS